MGQNVFNPNINAPLVPAQPTPSVDAKVTTFILQMTSGTATAGELITDIDLNAQAGLFGADAPITKAINAFRAINDVSQIDAIPVADNGTAYAGGVIDLTGSVATEAGSFLVYVGNDATKYEVPVVVGDTATILGDALVALITADTGSMISAINTTGSVALTANSAGTQGNYIGLKIENSIAGVTVALTAMASGAVNPATAGLPALMNERTDIITDIDFDYSVFVDDLDSKFNSENIALDGRCIVSGVDTKANFVIIGDAENSQSLVILADKPVAKTTKTGSAIFALPVERSAELQAIRTIRLEDGVALTGIITTTASRDQFGGVHMNASPLFNCKTNLPVIPNGEGFTANEMSDLKASGVSVMGNNRANNLLITGAILTTYKTNVQGLPDDTYKYLNYVDTSTACREYILNALAGDYGQSRLSLGQAISGHDIATEGGVSADMLSYMDVLGGAGYVLIMSGAMSTGETVESVIDRNLVVEFTVIEGKIYIETILPIMTQAREILSPLQIVFNVNEL